MTARTTTVDGVVLATVMLCVVLGFAGLPPALGGIAHPALATHGGGHLPGDGDTHIDTSITETVDGTTAQRPAHNITASTDVQALGTIRLKDTSGGAGAFAGETVLTMPAGVTISETITANDLTITVVDPDSSDTATLGVTGTSISSDRTMLTITHSGISDDNETIRINGLVINASSTVASSPSGTRIDIGIAYAVGSLDSGLLRVSGGNATSDDGVQIPTSAPCENILSTPPNSTEQEVLTDDHNITVFHEGTTTLNSSLHVDISQAGIYDTEGDLTPDDLAARTRINSYLFHFDQVGTRTIRETCTMRFNETVIGVMVNDSSLNASDGRVGAPGTTYPKIRFRGAETSRNRDVVSLNMTKDTVTVDFEVAQALDQVRVITKKPRQPPWDFGDAPDPSYPTTADSDGARHANATLTHLGPNVSLEQQARLTNQDTHDDGVTWTSHDTIRVEVSSAFAAKDVVVNVLFDRDRDGSWTEPGDWVVTNAMATTDGTGSATSTLGVPSRCDYTTNSTYMRVTLTTHSLTNYTGTGAYDEGETEDYEITGEDCPVEPTADLVLNKTSNVSAVSPDGHLNYTLGVRNDGPDATRATVTDDLPACVSVESTSGPGTYAGGQWTVDLGPNESATLHLAVTVGCSPGTVTNTANVTGNVTDTDATNNEANATITVNESTQVRAPGDCADVLVSPPNSTEQEVLTDDDVVTVFHEGTTKLDETLHVDITESGTYEIDGDLTPDDIGAGTRINSYMIHFDQVGTRTLRLTCTVHFNESIIGVMVNDSSLNRSDDRVGAPGTAYPKIRFRGAETSRNRDVVSVDLAANTVTVNFEIAQVLEQVRVITKKPRQPDLDFGDAPDPTYPTTAERDGARHANATLTHLGPDVSLEQQARLTNQDTHDDGVTWTSHDTIRVEVSSAFAAKDVVVNVLFDRDRDGSWTEPGDWVVTNAMATTDGTGSATSTLDVPSRCDYTTNSTYMRVTLTTHSLTNYTGTGAYDEGETEDYEITGEGCPVEPTADLDLDKRVNASLVRSGDAVTYTLVARNDGPNATSATVTDDHPSCVSVESASGPGTYAGGSWTVNLGPHETATLNLSVTVNCPVGNVTNTANATGNVTDPDTSDNRDGTTVTVTENGTDTTDLSLRKAANRSTVDPGGRVSYSLVVSNDGPNATRATVTDDLPACVSVESTSGPGTYAGGTWRIDLGPHETATLNLSVTVNCSVGNVINTANVTGNLTDTDTTDNEDTVTITIGQPESDVSIIKTANTSSVSTGETIRYRFLVSNDGPTETTVDVTDDLPGCMDVVSTTMPGRYDPATNTWTIQLNDGEQVILKLTAEVNCQPGDVNNTATISARGDDPTPRNNQDTAIVTVTSAVGGAPEPVDRAIAGPDRRIDTADLRQAILLWTTNEPVENTGGKRIDTATLRRLIQLWVTEQPA